MPPDAFRRIGNENDINLEIELGFVWSAMLLCRLETIPGV